MSIERFMPDAGAVEQIRSDLAVYEPEREKALRQIGWRVPLFVGPFVPVAVALAWVAFSVTPDEHRFIVTLLVACGALFLGHRLYEFARLPATDTQQWLRDRVLPIAFGFIDDIHYRHGSEPHSFSYLPAEVVGGFDRRTFDDVISGRHDGAPFELFECHLTSGSGKSTTTVFKGLIFAFEVEPRFDGKLVATRKTAGLARWVRDLFGTSDLVEVKSSEAGLDRDYEFRTDNPNGAGKLFGANLGRALSWVRETWPEEPARIALWGGIGFLLLPARNNFFELPDISVPLDYGAHIEPIAAQMASLVATAALVRQACAPVPEN